MRLDLLSMNILMVTLNQISPFDLVQSEHQDVHRQHVKLRVRYLRLDCWHLYVHVHLAMSAPSFFRRSDMWPWHLLVILTQKSGTPDLP